ncbi:UGSC family (seleno)protein [Citricoccus sp. GCM10030269]|uniref:UGSC family (seleno)protein n=1 Tax=Citricoccus sp. GCM10030269 TaxID=3273388 RepID=UPI003608783E
MTTMEVLIDPTGASERENDMTLSPRPGSLEGLTVGLLDNTKPNATALLERIAEELKQRDGIGEVRMYTKDYFGTPVKDELRDDIVRECDVVITAVGDCGSCSAATVHDGIIFERHGLPAVSIVSDSFLMSGQAMASLQGFPGYDFLAAAHPVASLSSEELQARAKELVADVERILSAEVVS